MDREFDIFSLNYEDSLMRNNFPDTKIPLYAAKGKRVSIPEDFTIFPLRLTGTSAITPFVRSVAKKFGDKGYNGNHIYTGLYEATLNAFQHGNGCNPDKRLIFAYKDAGDELEFALEDSCKWIKSKFINYMQQYKVRELSGDSENLIPAGSPVGFYAYTGAKKENPQNQGKGIKLMHSYFDEVHYFLGNEGLIVNLIKKK